MAKIVACSVGFVFPHLVSTYSPYKKCKLQIPLSNAMMCIKNHFNFIFKGMDNGNVPVIEVRSLTFLGIKSVRVRSILWVGVL